MENINIENIAEEVAENIEETMPESVQKNCDSTGKMILISVGTYVAIKVAKRGWDKATNWWKNRKTKKKEADVEIDMETPLPEIDEAENK
jgi:hypothetical protein